MCKNVTTYVREDAHAQKWNPKSDRGNILQAGRLPDMIIRVNFGDNRLRGFGWRESNIAIAT